MPALTIHAIDDGLYSSLSNYAKREHKSLNQAIKDILASALGVRKEAAIDHSEDFMAICGSITEEDANELRREVESFDRIDEELWK